ncbi:MAG TPA: acyl-CoA dehydrogenase family protein [Chondromyces sp.]|nr:acyl-CoA dehydrogenase family protein [Chondromyces sp.]
MSEMKEMIMNVVEKMFKNNVDKEKVDMVESGLWADDVWKLLKENGMLIVAVSEEAGGAGGDIDDLINVTRLVGKYAVPIPFIETTFANYLLESVNLPIVHDSATYSIDPDQVLTIDGHTVSGTILRAGWGRHVEHLVAFAKSKDGYRLVQLALADTTIKPDANLAGEPRDTIILNNVPIEQVSSALTNEQMKNFISIETALKTALMTGAIEKVNELTVRYTKEREQFGRFIHRFQLVQQHLVYLAGETAITIAGLDNLAAAIVENRLQDEVAYARIRTEEAIQTVTASAHQVHGAIGVTHEHSLHQYTRRLWAWRDEGAGESYWSDEIAQRLLTSTEDDLWAFLTASTKVVQI